MCDTGIPQPRGIARSYHTFLKPVLVEHQGLPKPFNIFRNNTSLSSNLPVIPTSTDVITILTVTSKSMTVSSCQKSFGASPIMALMETIFIFLALLSPTWMSKDFTATIVPVRIRIHVLTLVSSGVMSRIRVWNRQQPETSTSSRPLRRGLSTRVSVRCGRMTSFLNTGSCTATRLSSWQGLMHHRFSWFATKGRLVLSSTFMYGMATCGL